MKIILIPAFFVLPYSALVGVFQFSVPLLLLACGSLVLWIVTVIFPNFFTTLIRWCCVLVYCFVTIFHLKRSIYTIVFFLEDTLNFEKLFLLFSPQASDECVHCFVMGMILFVWLLFAILMVLYEIMRRIPFFRKSRNSKNLK
jgi:hypothetical protein